MSVDCPKCLKRHDTAGRKPGECFTCTCGNVLATSKTGRGQGVLFFLSFVGILGILFGVLLILNVDWPTGWGHRAKIEAPTRCVSIAAKELAYFAAHRAFVRAGPVPVQVPDGNDPVGFSPDEGFRTIGFLPKSVHCQYEVNVTGPTSAEVTARWNERGGKAFHEYSLPLSGEGD